MGTKSISYAIKFVSFCTRVEAAMDILKPFINNILYEIAIPIMLITQQDLDSFESDPQEYIRKQTDFTETLYMPKQILIDLIQQICTYNSVMQAAKRARQAGGNIPLPTNTTPEYLVNFLNYVSDNLNQYLTKIQQGEQADWRIKEALLLAVGHLADAIFKIDDLKQNMESVHMTHVISELSSAQPLLQLRACWMYG